MTANNVKNMFPIVVFVFVLQTLGMGYHSYASCTVFFLLSSFVVGFMNPSVTSRKMAMVLPIILFGTIVSTPSQLVGRTFAWWVFAEFLLAEAVVLLVSLMFFPRFAAVEVIQRFEFSLKNSADAFTLITQAMCVAHKTEADIHLLEAEHILSNLTANQQDMAKRLPLISYEPVFCIFMIYGRSRPCYSRLSPQAMATLSSDLLLLLKAMLTGVRQMYFNKFHAESYARSAQAFREVCAKMSAAVGCLTSPHDETAVDEALRCLIVACDYAYFDFVHGIQRAIDSIDHGDPAPQAKNCGIPTTYDIEAPARLNRLASGYFLFHFTELVETFSAIQHCEKAVVPFISGGWLPSIRDMKQYFTTATETKLKTGLRTVFLMGVGICFIEIPVLAAKFENGIWIVIAVVIVSYCLQLR